PGETRSVAAKESTGSAQPPPNPEPPVPKPAPALPTPRPPTPARVEPLGAGGAPVNLNSATFEELRGVNLSVTQATRVLAYRERFGGYQSVDELDKVPGFPHDLLTQV